MGKGNHLSPCCTSLLYETGPSSETFVTFLSWNEWVTRLVWKPAAHHLFCDMISWLFFSFSFLFISDGIPNVRRVPLYSNVSVPCPGFTAEEMTFTLYRGDDKFASITYGNMSLIRSQENLGRILEHSVNSSDNTTNFILLNVTLNATGLYTCMAEKAYPPPLVKIPEQPQIIVIVEGVYRKLFFSLAFSQFIRNNNNNLR